MARFKAGDADNYGGNGGGGFFSLKNDQDTARVRFLYNSVEDVEGMSVHEVEVDGKKRYVNCPREYNDPIEHCPFCAKGERAFVKVFVPLYNYDAGTTQIWERGKKFFAKMSSLCSRYPDISKHCFDIVRCGKAGDTATTYEIYEAGPAEGEAPSAEEALGSFVMDMTYEEMQSYCNGGSVNRGSEDYPRRGSDRRTPATVNRREAF